MEPKLEFVPLETLTKLFSPESALRAERAVDTCATFHTCKYTHTRTQAHLL